jgi:hypothetical protein
MEAYKVLLTIPHCLDCRLTDGGEVVSFTRRPPFAVVAYQEGLCDQIAVCVPLPNFCSFLVRSLRDQMKAGD